MLKIKKSILSCVIICIILTISSCSTNVNESLVDKDSLLLDALYFSNNGNSFDINTNSITPTFNSSIMHYKAVCINESNLVAKLKNSDHFMYINSKPVDNIKIDSSNLNKDIEIKIQHNDIENKYYVHCMDEDFPSINVTIRNKNIDPGYYILSPRVENTTYLLILDNFGVPRFQKKIDGKVSDFKRHSNGFYSYAIRTQKNNFNHWDNEIVILNDEFEEVKRLQTINLNHTDNHEFVITKENTYIFASYNSAYRDFSNHGLSNSELTRDSVVQEVSVDGDVLLEWNSFDYIDLNSCKQHRWPDDYAHINSISIAPDNNLVLSLRGCSQIVKINRSSGEIIWKLGGTDSNFEIKEDPFGEFCGQHTAYELDNNSIILFDNGGHCVGNRENLHGNISRAVEYKLDQENKTATFVKDHTLNNLNSHYTISGGSLYLTDNNNWLINWAIRNGEFDTINEVSQSGDILLSINMKKGSLTPRTYRVQKVNNLKLPINKKDEDSFYIGE